MAPLQRLWRGVAAQSVSRQLRYNSAQAGQNPVSPHIQFYRTFGRAIFKVLLMGTFTYQLMYWGWVKLEKDEIKREKTAELQGLEKQLEELTKDKKRS